jgi:hypothetical protein
MSIKFIEFDRAGKAFREAKKEADQFKYTVVEIIIG